MLRLDFHFNYCYISIYKTMKNQTITSRVPIEMNRALSDFAVKKFHGDKSDAIRFIFNYFFNEASGPKVAATYSIYSNVAPKILSHVAQLAHVTEKTFKAEVVKILREQGLSE